MARTANKEIRNRRKRLHDLMRADEQGHLAEKLRQIKNVEVYEL